MPTDWTYHVESRTGAETTHRLDGTPKTVTVDLDSFRVRGWTEDVEDIEAAGLDPSKMHYDEETDAYEEFADGAHATLTFTIDDGRAILDELAPEDGDTIQPRHMALLPPAERIVEQLDGVDHAVTWGALREHFEKAVDSGVHIERLDN